jgi:hypothetical protein
MDELCGQVRHPLESDQIRLINLTRNGKIARLPLAVRQELNRRLDEGEQGKKLVAWLILYLQLFLLVITQYDSSGSVVGSIVAGLRLKNLIDAACAF